ncbi:TPA: SMC-Scp complex subunit ScpB [Candidatus Woesearchaeota archaeon]|nr:SMC-Scp complex subunit ScpB [Candidatus Woesearchaeota archaeon]HIH32255.1 SMC-Scp complex subunit ScpB [Candidatus Woesearchaeota archaeon]HIH54787.1 SMC-Scp complex subunit ScpB [Candidatus Woesearchaeota archaeon]HIJ01367.1 SMC-Scp complex subunit ScpB [Candidatus Woesearchaeota archaeon]HIJ14413.1 SMC-Scp complex subunit ScpB [Candidatus Woesearchaeota archaeon]
MWKSKTQKKTSKHKTVEKVIEKPIIELKKTAIKQEKIKQPIKPYIIEAPVIEEIIKREAQDEVKPVIEQKPSLPKSTIKPKQETDDKNKVEALLFASGKYLDEGTISELCNIDKRKLRKILDELRKDYEKRNNALMIFNEGDSWKINVREKYLSIVRKIVADTELPKSVMETLAVIAWKAPIYQSEVVRIRGNKCYDHIEILEEAGFVSKEKKGRSYVLKTNDKFYNYFEIDHGNLKSVFDEVKVPEIKDEQKTLNPDLITEDETDKVKAIELKRWTESEEEKESHKQFLKQIEGKINEAHEKNKLLEEEIPKPVIEQPIVQQAEAPAEGNTIDPNQQPSDQQAIIHKPKSLTKKQLEKKFRDDIVRVREKMKQ